MSVKKYFPKKDRLRRLGAGRSENPGEKLLYGTEAHCSYLPDQPGFERNAADWIKDNPAYRMLVREHEQDNPDIYDTL